MASSFSGFRGGLEPEEGPSFFNDGRAARALLNSQAAKQGQDLDFASAATRAFNEREQALAYAREYRNQQKREERARQNRGLFGGAFNVLGTAASFIPVVGPAIGAGVKGIGGLFA